MLLRQDRPCRAVVKREYQAVSSRHWPFLEPPIANIPAGALNLSAELIDISIVQRSPSEAREATAFWETVTTALATLARRTGCSLKDSPLPEIREVAEDLDDWHPKQKLPAKRS